MHARITMQVEYWNIIISLIYNRGELVVKEWPAKYIHDQINHKNVK